MTNTLKELWSNGELRKKGGGSHDESDKCTNRDKIKQNESPEEGVWRTYQTYPRTGDI